MKKKIFFSNIPPNYLQGQSKMDINTKQCGIFFNKTLSRLFHFPTRKIGNFNFHSPYSYFVVYSKVGYLSHYLTKPAATARNFRGPQKTHSTPLKYTATSVCQFLGSRTFFSVTFCFLKKKTYHEVHTQKRTKQDTFPFFY